MQNVPKSPFQPIPARTIPRPWEDLASLISRTAGCMGYKNPQWILHPEESSSSIHPFNLCMLRERKDYQFLEQLLLLDEEVLYSLSLHRFTPNIQVPKSLRSEKSSEIQHPLLSRHIFQTFFRPYSATAVCSACLAEKPSYGRLYWNIFPIVACLQHNIFLTFQCPTCFCSIPLFRSSLTHCPRCKRGDYRAAPTISLSVLGNFREDQALLLSFLGIEKENAHRDNCERSKGSFPLLDILPWQYFQLLDAFRCILGPLFPNAPFLQGGAEARMLLRQHSRPNSTLSSTEWAVVIMTFHWLFQAWPNNFFTFLDTFPHIKGSRVRKRDQERITGVQRDFGVLYEKWLYKRLSHPSFAFLHEAFEDYLRIHYTTGEITRRLLPFKGKTEKQLQDRPYLTKVQARASLGIGEDVLQSLLRQGVLRAIKKPISISAKKNMFLIERASVEELQVAWSKLIPLKVLAQSHLGVTKAVVLALEDVGMLLPTRGPNCDGYKIRLYDQTIIKLFEQKVLSYTIKPQNICAEAIVPLTVFASKVGIPLTTLLKEILEYHLLPIEINKEQPLFQRLALPEEAIGPFLEAYKRRQREKQNLLTSQEVAIDLGISERVLKRWVQEGLIEGKKLSIDGKKPSLLFQKCALENFHRAYAFTEEVAELLGVTLLTVSKYVRKGKLHPVVGRKTQRGGTHLLFLREEAVSRIWHSDAKEDL